MGIDVGLRAGSRLGPYLVEEQIGRGGMSVVYRARHVKLERAVAIKILLDYASDAVGLERFRREAQTVARLRHAHILAVFDFGEEQGRPYMVTEYMPNGSLAARKRNRVLSLGDSVALLRPLADALDYAHAEGVVHRDVKPSNIFLDVEWRPVLADFGISKLHTEASLTSTGAVTGTPAYMSPEQLRGGELGGSADVYALAVVTFELLTGQTPFAAEDPWQVMYGQVHRPPPPVSSLRPELAAVDEVLAVGLAKTATERWPNCTQMVEALSSAARRRGRRRPWSRLRAGRPAAGRLRHVIRATTAVLALMAAALVAAALLGWLPARSAPAAPAGTANARTLVLDTAQPLSLEGSVTFHGGGLDPNRRAVAGFLQGQNQIYPLEQPLEVAGDGSFQLSGRVPSGLHQGPATLVACNVADDGSFQLGRDCAQARVAIL